MVNLLKNHLNEVLGTASLIRGGFYRQSKWKEHLMSEACNCIANERFERYALKPRKPDRRPRHRVERKLLC